MNTLENIEACNFECEAGPLALNVNWQELKEAVSLFVIRRKGVALVAHTQGKGGWGFSVFTNADEAQSVASAWNQDKYAGKEFCTVHPFLSVTTAEKSPPGSAKKAPHDQPQ